MTPTNVLVWSARFLGIVLSAFLALFALDAFAPGKPIGRALVEFALHLIPAAVVLTVVLVAWRRPWVGGAAFLLLAVAYAVAVGFRVSWVMAISGPLLAAGLLFLWSGWVQNHVGAS